MSNYCQWVIKNLTMLRLVNFSVAELDSTLSPAHKIWRKAS